MNNRSKPLFPSSNSSSIRQNELRMCGTPEKPNTLSHARGRER